MAGMAWQTTHFARTYKMPVPINAIKTFQQPLVGQKQKDQTCSLVKKHALYKNRTSQHEHVHELWQGWLGRLHMSPKHIKMPVPIMPQKPSNNLWLDKNRKTKTIRWSQIHAEACHKNIIKQEHSNNLWLDRSEKTNNVDWSKIHAQHGSKT